MPDDGRFMNHPYIILEVFMKNKIGIISVLIVILEFIAFLILGFNMQPGDEMGYGLIVFYIAFPITGLILSTLLAAKKTLFFFPAAILVILSPFILSAVFFGQMAVDTFDFLMGVIALVPCTAGGIIGLIINYIKVKKRTVSE